jgi:hypothetical protein
VDLVLRALSMAFAMGSEILWPLILGFALSAVVEAVISHQQMSRPLPDVRPRSIVKALALGGGIVIVFLCCRRARAVVVSQGRGFYSGDGFRNSVDQPGPRAQHHHVGLPGLAVHSCRIRRRAAHGNISDAPVPRVSPPRPCRAYLRPNNCLSKDNSRVPLGAGMATLFRPP